MSVVLRVPTPKEASARSAPLWLRAWTAMLLNLTLTCLLSEAAAIPLIEQLAERSFRRRQAAHMALRHMGRLAWPALARAETHPDLEVRTRVANLSAERREEGLRQAAASLMPKAYPKRPWISLPLGELAWRWLEAARKAGVRTGSPDWEEYRYATLLYTESLLRQRRPVPEILEELERMVEVELDWLRHNRPTIGTAAAR